MSGDLVGSQRVTATGIAYMTKVLLDLAEELCQGKILFTLEGGYDGENMRNGFWAVLSELRGAPLAIVRGSPKVSSQ
jgi:acetoin utilization deacetylase AcuC-like enzyme